MLPVPEFACNGSIIMWLPKDDDRLPRDPVMLTREVDALIKLSDVQSIQRYRDQLERKWWESAVVVLLFISCPGLILTIYKMIPQHNPLLFWFIFAWFLLFVLSLIATVEFLLLKITALRKLHEIHARVLDTLLKNSAHAREAEELKTAHKPDG